MNFIREKKFRALLINGMNFVSRKGKAARWVALPTCSLKAFPQGSDCRAKAQTARVLKVEFYDFIPHLCNAIKLS
ncbi:hypothetical protein [Nostoc sp. FACHB-110]|uniref:hypothetical protein n=1 Tax=Nostoc sp. FACHB-110 TaxID=2692834 RepID=UPI001689DA57|nr:hypothetical protein [Nostoc sp. FACHB-110]MBD2435681.1 hypothetical protein [Nostoc sp. FACHB-110]